MEKKQNLIINYNELENPFSLSIGDIMAGLLLIIILVLVSTLIQFKNSEQLAKESKKKTDEQRTKIIKTKIKMDKLKISLDKAIKPVNEIKLIINNYRDTREKVYKKLYSEFENDFKKWGATIEVSTLLIRFNKPNILFEKNSFEVKREFKKILKSFFPRYLSILTSDEFINEIEELRIEGHTSKEWSDPREDPYIANMKLSQDRTRAVLKYVINLSDTIVKKHHSWLQKVLTANGLSFSKPIIISDSFEKNSKFSRRVEFRIRTKVDDKFSKILKKLNILENRYRNIHNF